MKQLRGQAYLDLVKELDSKIPADAVSKRDGGRGMKLSYLEGWYVRDRLNKTLGQGNWSYTSNVAPVLNDIVPSERGDRARVAYVSNVSLSVQLPNGSGATFSDVGYGDGLDSNPGKAHELAVKEAVTDGLKRCAINLGMSMGLALYDKTQENVEDAVDAEPTPKPVTSKPGIQQDKVLSLAKVLISQGKIKDADAFRTLLKTKFNVDKAALLTDEQAKEVHAILTTTANGG